MLAAVMAELEREFAHANQLCRARHASTGVRQSQVWSKSVVPCRLEGSWASESLDTGKCSIMSAPSPQQIPISRTPHIDARRCF